MAWGDRQLAMETAQHWDRLPKNQPAEITMFQISEVQESPAFNGRRSVLTLRDRKEEGITFAEISIPPKRMVQETKRDQIEAEFLKWRTGEMKRRYQKTIDRLQKK